MKKLLPAYFVLFLFATTGLTAQQYYPVPDSAASWREYYFIVQPTFQGYCDYQLFAEGDTVLQNQHYGKIFKTSACNGNPGGYSETVHEFVGGIRNDSSKHVYFYDPVQSMEVLYYDFNNITIGQPLPSTALTMNSAEIVTSIDSVLVNGNYHKRYWLHDTTGTTTADDQLIEGVGSSYGLLSNIDVRFEHGSFLYCFYSTDTLKIDTSAFAGPCSEVPLGIPAGEIENEATVFPNPGTGNFTVQLNNALLQENLPWKLTDFTGRTIVTGNASMPAFTLDLSAQPDGIYFLFMQDSGNITRPMKIILAR